MTDYRLVLLLQEVKVEVGNNGTVVMEQHADHIIAVRGSLIEATDKLNDILSTLGYYGPDEEV